MNDPLLEILHRRAQALRLTREFFWRLGYTEIDTPLLSPALIPEHTITPLAARYIGHAGEQRTLFLVPSPELWMKRLLALGSGDIFQICRCFRNLEPPTPVHHPEFTMLEWYTTGKDYRDSLILQEEYGEYIRQGLGIPPTVMVKERVVDLTPPYKRLSMREAFAELAHIDLDALCDTTDVRQAAMLAGVEPGAADDWGSLFHRLFLDRVEPRLPSDKPLFLTDYPAAIQTLAQAGPEAMYAERWELFIGGIEIANCYTEERNPQRLKIFFETADDERQTAANSVPVDRELESIMGRSLPVCTGNALGMDRLLMVLLQQPTVADVLPFAWRKA